MRHKNLQQWTGSKIRFTAVASAHERCRVFGRDHDPPHFHIIASDESDVLIDIQSLEIGRLEGEAMTGFDVQASRDETELTWDGVAARLGISRRTVGYYV